MDSREGTILKELSKPDFFLYIKTASASWYTCSFWHIQYDEIAYCLLTQKHMIAMPFLVILLILNLSHTCKSEDIQ